jgi:hypothetical protein
LLRAWPQRQLRGLHLLAGVLLAAARILGLHFRDEGRLHLGRHQLAAHAHGTRGVLDVHHRAFVLRIDLDRGVRGEWWRRRSAAAP